MTYTQTQDGLDSLNAYTIQNKQFRATVIAADQQGAMDVLFKYMINCAAFTFRFDCSDIFAGSSEVPEGAKAGILEFARVREMTPSEIDAILNRDKYSPPIKRF